MLLSLQIKSAMARRDSVMSASAGQRATGARAALLTNLPEIDVIASELAGVQPSSGIAREEIDINSVAARRLRSSALFLALYSMDHYHPFKLKII